VAYIRPYHLIKSGKLNLNTNEQSRILSEINDSDKQPKLRTYKLFKTNYCLEPYLTSNLPKKTYTNIARFRVSSHNLKIETGRHDKPKTPIEERKCDKCNGDEIEDELHCLIICSANVMPRIELFKKATNVIPNFFNLNNVEQFKALMANKEPELIYALGNFLNKVMLTTTNK